jgi:hypothetical protein
MTAEHHEEYGSEFDTERGVVLDLTANEADLKSFEIVGSTMGTDVWARWDGRSLDMSRLLFDVASLSMAVEAVFAPDRPARDHPSFADDPHQVAIELARSLDHIVSLDFTSACVDGTRSKRMFFQ